MDLFFFFFCLIANLRKNFKSYLISSLDFGIFS